MTDSLETIYNFFLSKALNKPWRAYEGVSIHLSPDILDYIVNKWDTLNDGPMSDTFKAGFLMSLLSSPRKRLSPELKLGAEKVSLTPNLFIL